MTFNLFRPGVEIAQFFSTLQNNFTFSDFYCSLGSVFKQKKNVFVEGCFEKV